jgi:hypothetical protein
MAPRLVASRKSSANQPAVVLIDERVAKEPGGGCSRRREVAGIVIVGPQILMVFEVDCERSGRSQPGFLK